MNFTNKEAESIVHSMERIAEALNKLAIAQTAMAEVHVLQARKKHDKDLALIDESESL